MTATGTDVRVTGSSITSSGDTNLNAARDVILESAQETIGSQFKSKSSGASLGVNIGVAVVGGVTTSASVGVNASKSSGTATETSQANSSVTAGGTLTLTTGRDATLKGAVAQGKNVIATIGRDLSVISVQDTSKSQSSSAGFSASLSLSASKNDSSDGSVVAPNKTSVGGGGGISVGKSNANANIVSEQTALSAREGSLSATVKGNTDLKGGVIAALDDKGADSGKLTLNTATLTASDIKDSAKSKDVSVGLSASINNVTDKAKRSANLPVVDGSFASSTFKQDTKATIGQGTLTVGVPDANVTINRDVDASQVVTKDKSTGFTLYADVAAFKELVSTVKGVAGNETAAGNSVILQGVVEIKKDFDGDTTTTSQLVAGITNEIKSLGDNKPDSGALERLLTTVDIALRGRQRVVEAQALTIARDRRFAGKSAEEVGALRGADAVAQVRVQYGDAAATLYAASLETPEGKAQLLAVGQLTLAYRDNGGNLQAIKDGIIPANLRAGGNGTSGAALPEDVTVNGKAPTFGDKTVVVLAGAGKFINSIPPQAREAASFGTSVLLGGPVAAVGGYFIGKAIEKGIENSPEAQKNIGAVVKEVGLRGVSALSSATLDRNRSEAETAEADGRPNAFAESSNLLVAAGTLLSISTVKKLVDKAGGVLKGGINPGGGNVDVPNATLDTRPPLVPNNVTVTFENAGSRLSTEELNKGFRTAGTNAKAPETEAGKQLTAIIESSGVPAKNALDFANNFFASGVRPPIAVPISSGDTLVKVVPHGEAVTPFSGYFLTQSELAALTRNPGQIANRLGLPAGSQALQFDVFEVKALTDTTVFRSKVAPTINDRTGARTTGGATQTIVANRKQFTDPVKIGTINGFNPLPPKGKSR